MASNWKKEINRLKEKACHIIPNLKEEGTALNEF